MDLTSPISSVIPSAHGPVLAVLARAGDWLTGRGVTRLTEGRLGPSRVNEVLAELVASGIVSSESRPPAILYRLNRDHVASAAIEALADQRGLLIERARAEIDSWHPRPTAVWMFGSAARGDGDSTSDIDILVVRPDAVADDNERWNVQVGDLSNHMSRWSGNACEVLEMTRSDLDRMVRKGERLIDELRRDAIGLAGANVDRLLRSRGKTKAS